MRALLFTGLFMLAFIFSFSAIASTTVAGHAKWNGNTGNLADLCTFKKNDAGTMTYDEAAGMWTTTSPAVVHVKTRGNNNLKVEAVEELYAGTTKVEDVTVNYSGSTIAKPNGTTSNLNTDNLTVSMNNKAGKVKFTIAGTATMPADTDVVLAKNTEYTVKHKVTCIQ